MWFPNWSDTNRPVQSQKMARGWKFWIQEVEELYYPCSENKVTDQLHSYCEADLRLCFSHMQIVGFLMAHFKIMNQQNLVFGLMINVGHFVLSSSFSDFTLI